MFSLLQGKKIFMSIFAFTDFAVSTFSFIAKTGIGLVIPTICVPLPLCRADARFRVAAYVQNRSGDCLFQALRLKAQVWFAYVGRICLFFSLQVRFDSIGQVWLLIRIGSGNVVTIESDFLISYSQRKSPKPKSVLNPQLFSYMAWPKTNIQRL